MHIDVQLMPQIPAYRAHLAVEGKGLWVVDDTLNDPSKPGTRAEAEAELERRRIAAVARQIPEFLKLNTGLSL